MQCNRKSKSCLLFFGFLLIEGQDFPLSQHNNIAILCIVTCPLSCSWKLQIVCLLLPFECAGVDLPSAGTTKKVTLLPSMLMWLGTTTYLHCEEQAND